MRIAVSRKLIAQRARYWHILTSPIYFGSPLVIATSTTQVGKFSTSRPCSAARRSPQLLLRGPAFFGGRDTEVRAAVRYDTAVCAGHPKSSSKSSSHRQGSQVVQALSLLSRRQKWNEDLVSESACGTFGFVRNLVVPRRFLHPRNELRSSLAKRRRWPSPATAASIRRRSRRSRSPQ
jgi:hypothetical protein